MGGFRGASHPSPDWTSGSHLKQRTETATETALISPATESILVLIATATKCILICKRVPESILVLIAPPPTSKAVAKITPAQ